MPHEMKKLLGDITKQHDVAITRRGKSDKHIVTLKAMEQVSGLAIP